MKNKYSKGRYFHKTFSPVKHKTQYYRLQPVISTELVQKPSLKLVMEAIEQCKNSTVVNKTSMELLMEAKSNSELEDCRACLRNFFILREEFETYHINYTLDEHLKVFYDKNIVMTKKDIVETCCNTIRQFKCSEWYTVRRLRISASTNVHRIKSRTRKTIENLVYSILYPKNFHCEAIQYGLKNEDQALRQYEILNNCEVKKVGVIVSENQSWLCASIDGVVIENDCVTKLVEVKCPISCRRKPVINIDNQSCNVAYLKFINGKIELKKSHQYYTQVQSQMYITGMTMCNLFVYSPVKNGSVTVQVNRDEQFIKRIILSCEYFYFKHYLPALYTTRYKNDNKALNKRNFTGKNYKKFK
ncbi:hypothetical protein ABEB36_004012 [Hypothenemus hampei]